MSRLNALLPLITPMVAVAALSACAPREVILTGERLDPATSPRPKARRCWANPA